MKKFISRVLALIILSLFMCISVFAAEVPKLYGEYLYYEEGIYRLEGGPDGSTLPTIRIADCEKTATEIKIPEGINGTIVYEIGYEAFKDCANLNKVIIPNTIVEIGGWAFQNCSNLKSINIPESVRSLGWGAFRNCDGLENIILPNSIKELGNGVFRACDNLTSVLFSNKLVSIPDETFYNCIRLENVTMHQNLTHIGKNAFYGCASIKQITIPTSVTLIQEDAFKNCNALETVIYNGSDEDWAKIHISPGNECLKNANINFKTRSTPFTDVSAGEWYHKGVKFVYENGITSGVSATSFAPNETVTRGQFITMLCRAYKILPQQGENFDDCGNTWYTGYLAAVKQLGISSGVGNNNFAPEKEITREEMIVLIYNYLKTKGAAAEEPYYLSFSDTNAISEWAREGVYYATKNKYISGKENNIFDPQGTATRAELAQIFYNILAK